MTPIRFILVGGSLGAGKTTLLARATERLALRGKRVGLITNDQAADLVDTEVLARTGLSVEEVGGGCFCCGFNRLLHACDELIAKHEPDVLLGEPVGSCADLSAAVLQPMKAYCGDRFAVGPYTVLAEPGRLRKVLSADSGIAADSAAGSDGNVDYIYRKQLEEADRIVLTKTDLLTAPETEDLRTMLAEHFPGTSVMELSSPRGEGLDTWLDYVLSDAPAGRRVVEMDYDAYAAGEAELGWLNALVRLRWEESTNASALCAELLEAIRARCVDRKAEIGHVKVHLRTANGAIAANLTSNTGEATITGESGPDARVAALVLNARVQINPRQLRAIAEESLAALGDEAAAATIIKLKCFVPPRPDPTHRFDFDSPAPCCK